MFVAILSNDWIPRLMLAICLATIITIPLWGDPPDAPR
jgi:hypothetical protein